MTTQMAEPAAIRASTAVASTAASAEAVKHTAPRSNDGLEHAANQPALPVEQVTQSVDGINGFLESVDHHLKFVLHEEAERLMVEVVDDETDEVIKTIPPEELLDLSARISDMVGMLLDRRT